jgi:hypothetical protein
MKTKKGKQLGESRAPGSGEPGHGLGSPGLLAPLPLPRSRRGDKRNGHELDAG